MRNPVLTIFYQFDPWNATIGGIQTIVRSFIKYAPEELTVRFVGTSSDPGLEINRWHEAKFAGRDVLFMPLFTLQNDNVRNRIPTTVKYTLALIGRQFASDFMHFHRIEPTLAARNWTGDKTLFIHNDIHQQMNSPDSKNAILWRRFPQAYFTLERLLVNQFSQVLSCNSDSTALYQQRYPEIASKVSLVRNTVDNDVFYSLSIAEQDQQRLQRVRQIGLSDETQFILFAGRLHPQKDPLLLINTIAALQEPNVHLLIAGEGELAQATQDEIQRLGLSQQITMLGGMSQVELAEWHRLSRVFVLTSKFEGLPLVVLEALACGTPVVTTRCGETPKLLASDSGIVCNDRTPDEIARAIRQVLRYSDQYPREACIRVAKPYGAREVISNVYQDMLQRWKF